MVAAWHPETGARQSLWLRTVDPQEARTMSRVRSIRRAITATALSLAMLSITAAQVLASGGFPPFPK